MGSPILHLGAVVNCLHQGVATPVVTSPRVLVAGQPVAVLPSVYAIAGCTLPPPPTANGPCITATWVTSATRVFANGIPVLLKSSTAICAPTGTGLRIGKTQEKVTAT
jgi:uncharacterized Zn-binding protein involved in type VI secretion